MTMKAPIMYDKYTGLAKSKIPITRDFIRSIFGDKIEAIKVYRTCTGAGLKESKDAVEANNKDVETLLKLFEKYFPDYVEPENPQVTQENQDIVKGVEFALANWRILGFKYKFDAVRLVIDNFQTNTTNMGNE